jgi:aminoglycoside phosphotransferase (APT) family kinase protein
VFHEALTLWNQGQCMRVQRHSDQAILQNPESMRVVFQGHLKSAAGAAFDVRSCAIDYIRQSATRNVVQYTLDLRNVESGEAHSQIVTVASYGEDRTQKQWTRLMRTDLNALQPVGPLTLQPVVYVPDHDLLVQVFPYDYRLPGLMQLVNGSSDVLATLFSEFTIGAWHIETWKSEVLRYRPDMRAMVRLDVKARQRESGLTMARRGYAKVYREPDEGRRAFLLLQALWEQTQDADAAFSVAEPIAYVDDLQTLLLREASGDRLLHVVRRRSTAEAEAGIRRAARAVAGMHQVSLPAGLLALARREKQDQLADVAASLSRQEPVHATAIEELVSTIGQAMDESPQAPTHFDLKLGHILLDSDRDRVAILDFDKMAIGNPLVDVANLVATLGAEREGSQVRTERRAGLAEAFVDDYFANVPTSWRSLFPANFALAALIEAGTTGRGKRGRPEQNARAGRVLAALTQAQRALAGELW